MFVVVVVADVAVVVAVVAVVVQQRHPLADVDDETMMYL